MIYKMDNSTGRLSLYQTLQTRGAYDLEYFSIANKHFLTVANHWDGTSLDNSFKLCNSIDVFKTRLRTKLLKEL